MYLTEMQCRSTYCVYQDQDSGQLWSHVVAVVSGDYLRHLTCGCG
jgi:hypothetical protein